MITFNEIAILTVFTLLMSVILILIYRTVSQGSNAFLYMLFWMFSYWTGNIIAFVLFLQGVEFYEPVRVFFLNISTIMIAFGIMILGRDLQAIKPVFSLEKTTKALLLWTCIFFAALFVLYFQGMLDARLLDMLGRVHQFIIFSVGIFYMSKVLYQLRFPLQWVLLYIGGLAVLGIIVIRILTNSYGLDLTLYQNIAFAVEIMGVVPGLLLMWKRLPRK